MVLLYSKLKQPLLPVTGLTVITVIVPVAEGARAIRRHGQRQAALGIESESGQSAVGNSRRL